MESINEIFKSIAATTKKTDKQLILNRNKDNDTLLKVLQATYDPFTNYYMLKYKPSGVGEKTVDNSWDEVKAFLDKLSSREIVGKEAVNATNNFLSQFTLDDQSIIGGILKHNLAIGISPKVINTVWKDGVIIYETALAVKIENRMQTIKKEFDGKTWFASRKLDGLRCIAHVNHERCIFRTREGHEYFTLDNLKKPLLEAVRSQLPKEYTYVFDGECCIMRPDGSEDFQQILSEWNRDNWTIEHPKYKIFDFMLEDQFYMKEQSPILSERFANIAELSLDKEYLDPVEQIPVTSEEQVNALAEHGANEGWEGIMLRKNLPFEQGRSVNMLKIKPYDDDEFVVTGLESGIGTYPVKGKGHVKIDGVKVLKINYKGTEVEVGSGLTIAQRTRWKDHPEEIIGKTITVQYFHEIIDKDGRPNLRFPVLKAVYDNGRHT